MSVKYVVVASQAQYEPSYVSGPGLYGYIYDTLKDAEKFVKEYQKEWPYFKVNIYKYVETPEQKPVKEFAPLAEQGEPYPSKRQLRVI